MNAGRIFRWTLAGASAVVIVIVAAWDTSERMAPGPLHGSHGGVMELAGNDGCAKCHGGWRTTMAEACQECHDLIAAQVETGRGMHGAMGELVESCQTCHIEHTNGAIALVSDHAFLAAGAGDPDFYDHHDVADFTLEGAHDLLECRECHVLAKVDVLASGRKRFLGLDQTCTTCHEDPHGDAFGQDCAECHGQDAAFDSVAAFEHDPAFPLEGGHHVGCGECHVKGTAWEVSVLEADPTDSVRACTVCHESPHTPAMMTVFGGPNDCAECHAAVRESFTSSAALMSEAAHTAIGFPLADAHANVDCVECHGDARDKEAFTVRYPGRAADDCAACHEDPHEGQFDSGPSGGRCTECHDNVHFEPSLFDVDRHAETDFPIVDAHLEVTCDQCHEPDVAGFQQFIDVPTACASCHDDPHEGQFDAVIADSDCTTCHGTAHFMPSLFDIDRHADTEFPLTGGHEAVGCDRCHPREEADGVAFTRFTPTTTTCSECHEDAHMGLFDDPGLPVEVDGETGCARCHDVDQPRFAGVRFEIGEHLQWTDYALEGAHAEIDCLECHQPGNDPDPRRRAFGRASRACVDCHDNPHDDQFEVEGVTDCASCHGFETFELPGFDHDATAFPLDETHAAVACDRCHRPGRDRIVRYKPLGTECQDCHGFGSGDGR